MIKKLFNEQGKAIIFLLHFLLVLMTYGAKTGKIFCIYSLFLSHTVLTFHCRKDDVKGNCPKQEENRKTEKPIVSFCVFDNCGGKVVFILETLSCYSSFVVYLIGTLGWKPVGLSFRSLLL